MARDEHAAVRMTERLGKADSPLAVDELLEALADPRFQVRFEAILAIARMKPHPRLISALSEILAGNNPSLSVIAAWALGRIGDEHALDPLRRGLEAGYRSIQAHSARSLGVLGDIGVIPRLLRRLKSEPDEGLRVAFASALGNLRASSATGAILEMLRITQDESIRWELALALARIANHEYYFIQLWRSLRNEGGTALAQAVTALKRKLKIASGHEERLLPALNESAEALAHNDFCGGAAALLAGLPHAPHSQWADVQALVLRECAVRLHEHGDARREYLLLALVALDASISGR
jgi:HEAT repeat protein